MKGSFIFLLHRYLLNNLNNIYATDIIFFPFNPIPTIRTNL